MNPLASPRGHMGQTPRFASKQKITQKLAGILVWTGFLAMGGGAVGSFVPGIQSMQADRDYIECNWNNPPVRPNNPKCDTFSKKFDEAEADSTKWFAGGVLIGGPLALLGEKLKKRAPQKPTRPE